MTFGDQKRTIGRRLFIAAGFLLLSTLTAAAAEPISFFGVSADGLSPATIFLAIAAATLVSEDLAAISAGVLAGQDVIGLPLAVGSSAFGILVGDLLLFLAGRFVGRPALRLPAVSYFVTESAIDRSSRWLENRGMAAIFISRFVVGTRLPLYVAAGILRTSFWKFAIYFSMAVAVWTPLLVGASYFLGGQIVSETVSNFWIGISAAALVVGLYFGIRLLMQALTWKGRRILWGRIKRRFIWEFWSVRVFYIPVVAWIVWLGLRYRQPTLFAAANPGIPGGGFVGESKDAILRMIAGSAEAREFLPRHVRVSGDDRVAEALAFATGFPVVLKPDAGERGFGVRIVRSREELSGLVEESDKPMILQEFVPGEEVSLFYFRRPGAERGEIFAITEKRFPAVVGDGRSTVEELILSDNRAICLAASYLEQNAPRLAEIPEAGERVAIIDIGTHSRGAVFLDGDWMKSAELERRFDEICAGIEGFFFGRFDIRVESFERFSRGEAFRIVELNGVTSEATNIYDPAFTLRDAYRKLFRQWEIAFEIGKLNQEQGNRPATVRELISMYRHRPR